MPPPLLVRPWAHLKSRHPELLLALQIAMATALALVMAWQESLPSWPVFILLLLVVQIGVTAAWIDMKFGMLPARMTDLWIISGILLSMSPESPVDLQSAVIGAMVFGGLGAILRDVFYAMDTWRGRIEFRFGGGDVKALAAIGATAGIGANIEAILPPIAVCVTALCVALLQRALKTNAVKLRFGPWLATIQIIQVITLWVVSDCL